MALINVDFFSQSLGYNTQMSVILPEKVHDLKNGILNRTDGYPVLWLLHGASEDHTAWQRHTSIERYAMDYSLAVVMPAAQLSFYSNMVYGGHYYDFLTNELPEIVRDFFPISDKREDNFIAGSSMGGYGALKLGLSKPEQYSAIGCFSLGAFMHCQQNTLVNSEPVRKMLKNVFDIQEASELQGTEHDPIELVDRMIRNLSPKPNIFHSCGMEDDSAILDAARVTRDLLIKKAINYTYQEEHGGHTWEYWDTSIQKYLKWLFNK